MTEDEEGVSVRGNQILPVAILPFDFDGVPLDGAQYLAVVRQEASAAPAVVRSSLYDVALFDDDEEEKESSRSNKRKKSINGARQDELLSHLPSHEWQSAFLARFRNMRESLANRPRADGGASIGLPRVTNARKWFRFIYHVDPVKKTDKDALVDDAMRPSPTSASVAAPTRPSTTILRHFHTAQLLALLHAFHIWIEEGWQAVGDETNALISSRALDALHSQWIFALLAHLDERLVGDDISLLRDLARTCIAQIVRVRTPGKGVSCAEILEDEQGAWIVVCAIAGIWAQFDLWEDASSSLQVDV